jgi:hypothetical protein
VVLSTELGSCPSAGDQSVETVSRLKKKLDLCCSGEDHLKPTCCSASRNGAVFGGFRPTVLRPRLCVLLSNINKYISVT